MQVHFAEIENLEKESGFQDHKFTFVLASFRYLSDIEEHEPSKEFVT